MFSINNQRIWCFRAALNEVAEAQPVADPLANRGEDNRLSPHLDLIGLQPDSASADDRPHTPAQASLRYVSKSYAAFTPPNSGPRSGKKDPAQDATILDLSPELTHADLKRLRRKFALHNHPDRVISHLRGRASENMAVANAMIDKAMRCKPA